MNIREGKNYRVINEKLGQQIENKNRINHVFGKDGITHFEGNCF